MVQLRGCANWRVPAGPGSSITGKDNHPVVHIAYEDALETGKMPCQVLAIGLPSASKAIGIGRATRGSGRLIRADPSCTIWR